MRVKGGKGADHLIGTDESDIIIGGKGNDIIEGGDRQDMLKGGKGRDTFVFTEFDADRDIIRDFQPHRDRIVISLAPDEFIDTSGFDLVTRVSTHVMQDDVPMPVVFEAREVATGVRDLIDGYNLIVA